MDPYRDAVVREQARTRVAEPEKPPRGVRVRAWTDGTTELRLSSARESHLVVADGLGYDASTLRWIARRLQRALEAAR